MIDVIQCTCSHCSFVRFFDAPREVVDASTLRALSSSECPACRKRDAVVTLNAEPRVHKLELAPLPGASRSRPFVLSI
jgi:hypothetical protein